MSKTAFSASQNALSTTAKLVCRANVGRRAIEVKNIDASIAIYIGPTAAVTASNGHLIAAGESFVFEDYDGPVYAVAASGTPTVTTAEW